MFGREFTKYTVIHGAYIRYFGRDPTIYTVIHGVHTVFLQKYHHIYDHIRCMYGIFGRDTTKYTVIHDAYIQCFGRDTTIYTIIYGVCTVFLAGIPPKNGHIRCIYTVLANPV
jgi:ribosomal protein L27